MPLETDILNLNKNAMISIGHVLQDMIGTSTLFSGLGCVPTSPASMTVNVNPGRAYSLQNIDNGAYSSLSADTAHQIVKQGIILDVTNFSCPAPTTAGFSINYLVQGAFQEVDGGSVVLPYYNASNPAQAYNGPNGTGTSQATYRDNTVQLSLKAGVAATTGTQVTPTPDAGFNGLWVITVAYGASTIVAGNITQYGGAPFLTANLLSQIQTNAAAIAAVPTAGRLLRTSIYRIISGTQQVQTIVNGTVTAFTTTGASQFNPLAATNMVEVECNGGGGAGAGGGGAGASAVSLGAPGTAGSYGRSLFAVGAIGAGVAVTVGAGGAGASNAAGGNGGTSAFGALLSCPGGAGGGLFNNQTPPTANGNGTGSAAVTGANVVSLTFTCQSPSIGLNTSNAFGAAGGNGAFGTGAPQVSLNTNGGAAANPGTGGSGVALNQAGGTATGGNGAAGIIIVREYA